MSHTAHCVYLVTCKMTSKQYVGCTTMKLSHRLNCHKLSGPMVEDIGKFGIENFVVVPVEYFSDKEQALVEEARQIKAKGTHAPNGYNRQVRGGKYPGRGGPLMGNKNSRRHKVEGLRSDGLVVCTFSAVLDASRALGVERSQIQRALRISRYTAGGLFWKSVTVAEHGG